MVMSVNLFRNTPITDIEGKPGKTTFLELATHNAGLPRNSQADVEFAKQADTWMLTNKEMASIKAPSMDEFLKSLRSAKREYPEYELKPQDTRQYSNMGYALLGLGLGRAAKASYQEAVLNRIAEPLQLNNTGFGTVSDQDNVLATGYSYLNNEQKFIKTPNYYANAMAPAGGYIQQQQIWPNSSAHNSMQKTEYFQKNPLG
jgi:CubicO group peptidase (beta-lactamase class C family)